MSTLSLKIDHARYILTVDRQRRIIQDGAILIEGEFGAGKPDAAVYRHALDTLGARAEETRMVGDHLDFDVAGAQQLGMQGIWIDRAGEGLPAGCVVCPDRIIRTLTELD